MRLNKKVACRGNNEKVLALYQDIIRIAKSKFDFAGDLDTENIYFLGGAGSFGETMRKNNKYYIALNSEYLGNCLACGKIELIINTLVHEICHCLKDGFNHGTQWKKYASVLGGCYGVNVTRCGGDEEEQYLPKSQNKIKYILTCTSCGAKWYYCRSCRTVQRYQHCHCSCNGRLSLEIL